MGCELGSIPVKTTDGKVIGKGEAVGRVMELFGEPREKDLEDEDDIVLTYKKNGFDIEFEFGGDQNLVRINCFLPNDA